MDATPRNLRSLPSNYKNARTLPPKYALWCKRCERLRPLAAFANNRQKDASYLMTNRGARLGDAKVVDKLICNDCSGAPKTDLRCTGCGNSRPLDHFSTTQRNDPDTAMCRKCISEIENVMPGQQEHEEEGSDEKYLASMGGSVIPSHSSSSGGVSLAPSNGFEPVPSTTRGSHLTTNTAPSGTSITGRSSWSTASTVTTTSHRIKASGWIDIPKGPRFVPVPDLEDDYAVEDDGKDYQM
ncbi:hypothetical protein M436DRAFT_55539 [Aureobasidium namibiae CBS 147.97]|uniref:Stc1 domain-containing protein n=1 Tax=Aureobasidium namibiae CBS 147.97 TaxID=1043004 RepID=A0A074WIS6_9PEZI